MITWRQAYERQQGSDDFKSWFGKNGVAPKMSAFRPLAYTLDLSPLAAGTVTGGTSPSTAVTPGATVGPVLTQFNNGAVILGITASAVLPQTVAGAFQYAPSMTQGRRDLFALNFSYTGDEILISGGLTLAEALLGGGYDTIFPAREILIPNGSGILTSARSYTVQGPINVQVVFHCMVLRNQ